MQCIFCCAFFLVANAVLSPRRRRDLLCPDHPGDALRPTEGPPSPLPRPRPRTDTFSAAPWCALALKVHLSGVSHRKMPPTSGPSIGPRTLASAAASPGAGVGAVTDVDAGVSTGAGASTSALAGAATGASANASMRVRAGAMTGAGAWTGAGASAGAGRDRRSENGAQDSSSGRACPAVGSGGLRIK